MQGWSRAADDRAQGSPLTRADPAEESPSQATSTHSDPPAAGIVTIASADGWSLEHHGYDTSRKRSEESVFSLTNGFLGVRASRDEGSAESTPALFMAGVYDEGPTGSEDLVIGPDITTARILIDGETSRAFGWSINLVGSTCAPRRWSAAPCSTPCRRQGDARPRARPGHARRGLLVQGDARSGGGGRPTGDGGAPAGIRGRPLRASGRVG